MGTATGGGRVDCRASVGCLWYRGSAKLSCYYSNYNSETKNQFGAPSSHTTSGSAYSTVASRP